MTPITIRAVRAEDVPVLYRMLRESAVEQGGEHKLCANPENLVQDGFESRPPRFQCLLAECGGEAAGIALYFPVYSTWISRTALYLEDLYVTPEFRRRGVARALMQELAAVAQAEGCGFIRWLVLRDNSRAIRFYESLGAQLGENWPSMLIEGDALSALARSATSP